jgi:class 3 adenylate cyclase
MTMTGVPTGTVTFMFTDIEGSTARWEQHPEAMRIALARHDSVLKASIRNHEGIVFSEMGDGLAAAFARAGQAVAAAVEAQQALCAEPWAEDVAPICVRWFGGERDEPGLPLRAEFAASRGRRF